MFKNLKQLTTKKDRTSLLLLFFILLFSTAIELIGLGSIPIFAMIIVEPEKILQHLPEIFNFDFIYDLNKKTLTFFSAIILFIIFILKNTFLGFVNYFQGNIFRKIKVNTYNNLFFSYLKSPYEFHITRNPAQLIRNVTAEVNKSAHYILNAVMLVKETLVMLLIFALLLAVDSKISLLTFGLLAAFSFIFFFLSKKGAKVRGKTIQKYFEKQIKTLNHALGSIKETKILNKEKIMFNIFKSNTETIEKNHFYQAFIVSLPRLFLEVMAITTVLIVSVSFVFFDRPFENFVPLIALITVSAVRLIPSFNIISSSIQTMRHVSPSFRLIAKEISNLKKVNLSKHDLVTSKIDKKINNFKNSLEIKNLIYYYPNTNKRAIDNVSFNIDYGDVIGIIGSSGAGKSTLIDLMTGLLKPSEGQILVDGINIEKCQSEWQKQIGYVPQDIYLLDASIKENIAFGIYENEFNQEYFSYSVKLAQLAKFIDTLPDKENTIVGDRGIRLSGGQKQRIGIARSLYLKPNILIFDEPTSALDIYNEKKIMDDLYSLGGNLTIIIISHRYTVFERCKKILKLNNGKIYEIVDYKDFLSQGDHYIEKNN